MAGRCGAVRAEGKRTEGPMGGPDAGLTGKIGRVGMWQEEEEGVKGRCFQGHA